MDSLNCLERTAQGIVQLEWEKSWQDGRKNFFSLNFHVDLAPVYKPGEESELYP